MQDSNDKKVDRRTFLNTAAGVVAGSAIASSALSYDRIIGANDRIALGHIGVGNRGSGLHMMTSRLKDKYKVETIAVCDLWKSNRERAVGNSERYYGRAPRAFQYLEDLLAFKDVDAVLIATPEHSHSTVLKATVEAGKDAYCEKPMGNVLEEVKAARDAVKQSNRVVQVGTQHRSEPYQRAAREVVHSGVLGDVSKYEIVWNYNGPRWRGRPQVKQLREQDTDWKKWLMTKPYRPFDPQLYFEFRLYSEFSSGIPDQWMSHGIDLVHFFMNEQPPRSVMAHGGIFAWHDGRENPDTFHALVEYPSFLASYSTSFGNDSDSFSRIMGKTATLINIGGEGSPRWKVVEEKGNHEDNPTIERAERWVTLPGDDKPGPINIGDEDVSHMSNWFECLRSRNTRTNATVDNGYLHSVATSWRRSRTGRASGCTTMRIGADQGLRARLHRLRRAESRCRSHLLASFISGSVQITGGLSISARADRWRVSVPCLMLTALVSTFAVARPCLAQVLYGRSSGDVKDSTEASVPGANVVITNKNTGLTRETVDRPGGHFNFPDVPAGVYGVKASQQGFKTVERSEVNVSINSVTRVDVALEVGAMGERSPSTRSRRSCRPTRPKCTRASSRRNCRTCPFRSDATTSRSSGCCPASRRPPTRTRSPPTRRARWSSRSTARATTRTTRASTA